MALDPQFASTPLVGYCTPNATADNVYTAPTHYTAFTFSASVGANGALINEVDVLGTGTTLAGNLNFYLYDGTNYHMVWSCLVSAVTAATGTPPFGVAGSSTYTAATWFPTNVVIPSGWTFGCSSTVASQLVEAKCYAANI